MIIGNASIRGKAFFAIMSFFIGQSIVIAHAAPVVANGSLSGGVVQWELPDGWSAPEMAMGALSTEDPVSPGGVIDHWAWDWDVSPVGESPDGGTWVGISGPSDFGAKIWQDISGFEIGSTYRVEYYWANFGIDRLYTSSDYRGPNSIEVMIGTEEGNSNWDFVSVGTGTIQATSALSSLKIRV